MKLGPTLHRRTLIAAAVAIFVVAVGWSAPVRFSGESWPMLGGTPSRNMVNPFAKNVPTDWSVEEGKTWNIKWSAELGNRVWVSPVIAGGKVFIGTNNAHPRNPNVTDDKGIMMCFEEATGKFLWQAVHDKLDAPNENDFPQMGIASTPTLDGDRLYYVSNRWELICAGTEGKRNGTADIIWRLDMIKDLAVCPCPLSPCSVSATCSPLVVGDLVYVVTGNGVDQVKRKVVNPKAPSFIAVDKKTGEVKWTSNLPGGKVLHGQWSSPVYAEVNRKGQVIFPGGDGWLYSFEPITGELIWKFDCNPKGAVDRPGGRGTRNSIVATPVVADGKLYVGVGRSPDDGVGVGHLWCIDITKKGDVSPVGDSFDPKDPVNKDSALVWHYGGKNPVPNAKRESLFHRTVCSCAAHDGLVYAADIYGYLYCLNAHTGELHWDYDLQCQVFWSLMVMDGKVYVGTDDGDLVIFKAGKQKPAEELAKIDMLQSLKSAPVFVNGVLYVVTSDHLYAIK